MVKFYLIFFILIFSINLLAQDSKFKLFIKGGISDYGDVNISFGNGGAGEWEIGPIVGLGVEYDLQKNWFLQGTIEYSENTFDRTVYYAETLEPGSNSVVDLLANIKKRWNWFYLAVGIGYSFQSSSDSYVSGTEDETEFRKLVYEGTTSSILSGLLGVGFEFNILQDINVFLEGSWRLRKYVTPSVQLGINYNL
jgi:opacity protein-like surface antigen